MWQQMLRFGVVGALATVVHMVIGYLLIASNWQPHTANFVAFGTAFMVSFVGHLGFSFADQDISLSSAVWKFTIVALMGFACNQALLTILIASGHLPNTLALCASTSCAAVLTFFLSKVWAFRAVKNAGQMPIILPKEPI
jgi:putative flippase GtrA